MTMEELNRARVTVSGTAGDEVTAAAGCAMQEAETPLDVLYAATELRDKASRFRVARQELDRRLAEGDLGAVEKVTKALGVRADALVKDLGYAGMAGAGALTVVAKGGLAWPELIAGLAAALKSVWGADFTLRLLNRLRRPEIFFLSDTASEARRLTEALPAVARIWRLSPLASDAFAERFKLVSEVAKIDWRPLNSQQTEGE